MVSLLAISGCGDRSNLAGPLVINSFNGTPAVITAGQSTTLAWSVTIAAVKLSISDGSGNASAANLVPVTANSVSVAPSASTTYTLTATDAKGNSATATALITVVPMPAIASFAASPALIATGSGQSSTLSWTVSGVAGGDTRIACGTPGCGFSNANYGTSVPTDPNTGMGSITVNPTATTQYTLYAINAAGLPNVVTGTFAFAYATVTVVPTPSILGFTASPATIGPPVNGQNQCSTLSWAVSGATTSITITDNIDSNVTQVNASGNTNVCPAVTTVYTLTATDLVNSYPATATQSATVTVTKSPPPSIASFNSSAASIPAAGHVSLTAVFTPTDATATVSQCTATVTECNAQPGLFQQIETVNSGVPFDTGALPASSTFALNVSNGSGSSSAQIRVLAGDVSLVAGTTSFSGYLDGPNLTAQFYEPNGIVADSSGNLFIADTGNNVIRKITPAGQVSTYAGNPGIPGSGLPGVAGSNDGPADCGGAQKCAEFNSPQGLAIDSAGNLYVADTANYTIRMITPAVGAQQAEVTTIAGVAGLFGSQSATPTPALQATFGGPVSLAFDITSGNLYVADQQNQSISVIVAPGTAASTANTLAGPGQPGQLGCKDGVGTAANFDYPSAVAVDSRNGVLYVADNGNNIVRKITPAGTVTTFAGACNLGNYLGAGSIGSADGTGPSATFYSPNGLAVDEAGNLYVTDSNNYTIRMITPTPDASLGVVTTILGKVGKPDKTLAGGPLPARLNFPAQITTVPSTGTLFITVYTNPGDNSDAILSAPY